LKSTLTAFEYAQPTAHPKVVEILQIEDVIGAGIVDVMLGRQDAQSALDKAAEEVAEIMKSTE
jgi:ABC-type glycerol-3-phosphate transport system substrate-binding protein